MTCEFAHLDGSYVLGALSPAERQQFEEHLAGCPQCARAVRELAGLPGLLGRVDPEILELPPEAPRVPDTLLPALVREVRRTQRRRLLVTGGLAAAAVTVVVGATAVFGTIGQGDRTGAAPPPSASATVPAGQDMAPVDYGPVTANLAFESVAWGTRLDLTCHYAPTADGQPVPPATYALVVRTRDGHTEQVATWRALPGRTMQLTAATAAGRDDIASVEVRTADGRPVLKLIT
jgi:hypothetical protein